MCWWVEVVEVMKIWKKEGGIWLLWQMFENPKVACANGGLHRYLCKWWRYYTCRQTNLMLWSCSISLAIWYTPSSHKDDILQLMVDARNCHSHFWWGSCWDLKWPVARKIEKQFVHRASNSKNSLFFGGLGPGCCFPLGEAYQWHWRFPRGELGMLAKIWRCTTLIPCCTAVDYQARKPAGFLQSSFCGFDGVNVGSVDDYAEAMLLV